MNKTMQKKYARLIARVGANIKKGQPVRIYCEADQHEFITILVEECYKAGAKRVQIEWYDDDLDRLQNKKQSLETMKDLQSWKIEKYKDIMKEIESLEKVLTILCKDNSIFAMDNRYDANKLRFIIGKYERDLIIHGEALCDRYNNSYIFSSGYSNDIYLKNKGVKYACC